MTIINNTLIEPDIVDTSNLVQALRNLGEHDHADRVEACGSTTPGVPYPKKCKSRWCRNCQATKGKAAKRKLFPRMDFSQHHYFATLVYADVAEITPEHVQGMKKAVARLREKVALKEIRGAYGALEVSYHPTEAHPYHLHAHLLLEGRLKQKGQRSIDVLTDAWVRSGGESDVRHRFLRKDAAGITPKKEIQNCFRYMSKGLSPTIPALAQESILRAFGRASNSFCWSYFRGTE